MTEINTESLGFYIPTIDDRSEETIASEAQTVVFNRSNGLLNDFSDHSPVNALIQGQAYAAAELLYRVNKLPLALLIKFLEITGTKRSLGRKATVSLTFTLTAPRDTPFEIPANFEVVASPGQLSFYTDTLLIIPAGTTSGIVSASAREIGQEYNLPAYTIDQFTQPLSFLSSVINTEDAQGGESSEAVEATIDRALKVLRRRNLVSEGDFTEATEEILGAGSRAKTIGLLGKDRITTSPGAVHVFCLDATGEPANASKVAEVYQGLSPRLMLGTQLFVSPMELLQVNGEMIAKLQPQANPTQVADALWQAYQNYLSPVAFEPGSTLLIKELEHNLRFVTGLTYIDQLTLNSNGINIPMPNKYTLPTSHSLLIQLVDESGNIFNTLRGIGEPPES